MACLKLIERGEGLSEIRRGYWMYEKGKTEDNPDTKGLAFLIHHKIKDCYIFEDIFKQND